jgi:HD-GYP domain-containing protein (c-di-GMP phosphodiesterase class II)
MAIDYKKELEAAAKSMILVHEPDVLIKMIVRLMVQKVKVKHAGILLHEKDRDTYVLTVSRGPLGAKIPVGFARMDADNPLIRFFRERRDKLLGDGAIVYELAKKILIQKNIPDDIKELLKETLYQMEMFEAVVCIPSYFRKDLLGVLLLGNKKNRKKFTHAELDFFIALASDVAMAIRNAQLFRELELELDRKHRLFIHTTVALTAAIDAKDHYTHGHTGRVTTLSLEIARRLMQKKQKVFSAEDGSLPVRQAGASGGEEKFLEDLHIAALLHDIGKIGVPESILNKEGPLTDEERKKIKEHTLVGITILQPISELEAAISGVKYHHEKYDGSGYPEGLKGEQIPLIASIISVADAFDAMITDRPYRHALSKEKAAEEIKHLGGKQFDPQIADCLFELYQEGKI